MSGQQTFPAGVLKLQISPMGEGGLSSCLGRKSRGEEGNGKKELEEGRGKGNGKREGKRGREEEREGEGQR